MNILYYLRKFPSISTSFITNEILELSRQGHDIYIFALSGGNSPLLNHEHDMSEFRAHYIENIQYSDIIGTDLIENLDTSILQDLRILSGFKKRVMTAFRITQCLNYANTISDPIDLVHTHFAIPATLPAIHVARKLGVPFTATTHAFDLYRDPDIQFLRSYLNQVDTIVTISRYNKRYIERDLEVQTPIKVIHAGIRPEKYVRQSQTKRRQLITNARFVEKKGIKDALRAVSILQARSYDLNYNIIGNGPLREELEQAIESNGLENTVTLLGNVGEERLIEELTQASVFVLPCCVAQNGDRDGIPVALMEAMAAKTVPVTTTVSGIPELVEHGTTGLLVPSEQKYKLADAIERLLTNHDEREQFANCGRIRIQNDFDVTSEVKKLAKLFKCLSAH